MNYSLFGDDLTAEFHYDPNFQTLPVVGDYMASLLPEKCGSILEPTPGAGQLVTALRKKGTVSTISKLEELAPTDQFDWIVMNPPFTPMLLGFDILQKMCILSNNIVCLLPWIVILNSSKRMNLIQRFGLVGITHLPRKAFPGSRVQTCIIHLQKGYCGSSYFKFFNW